MIKERQWPAAILISLAILFLHVTNPASAAEPSAGQLVTSVLKSRESIGFRGRARVVTQKPAAKTSSELNLSIKGRSTGDITQLLYQALWPQAQLGRAIVIRQTKSEGVTGYRYAPPDIVEPLPRNLGAAAFFNTRLTVEEVVEPYWYWPAPTLAGHETLLKRDCLIVEFHPPTGAASSYSKVKVWISPETSLPLLTQKFGKDGQLVMSLEVKKILQQGRRWVTSTFSFVPEDGRPATTFTFVGGDLDQAVPEEDFTPKGLAMKTRVVPAKPRP